MKNANEYGFLPENDAENNAKALQALVDRGGEILVEKPGIYDLSETIEIGNDTTLRFLKGVQIRRKASKTGKTGVLFLNKGCDSATYNTNVKIIGLHIDCNGVESTDHGTDSRLVGMRAHVCMMFIKDLVIEDFECTGILTKDYGIQISAFENIHLENLYCQGDKDGIHLGWGKGFVIRHARICTFDDPIALNAFDYAPSNPHVGWIEDGLIEDCYDLSAETTTGHFCRILGGAWCDWHQGMQVQHSDTVCYNGRVYRAIMKPDGNFLTSNTPPSHPKMGEIGVYDGISWVCVRQEAVYDCGCRNIVLRDIHLQKERDRAIHIALNQDVWARSYTAGCHPIAQSNITLENISVESKINFVLHSNHPCKSITVKNTDLKDARIAFASMKIEGLTYPMVNVTLENVTHNHPNCVVADIDHPVCVTEY